MNANLHSPKITKTTELTNSNAIVLNVEDDKGNSVSIFFDDYKTFFNFSQIVRQGGTYGNEYNLETGEKTK
jgi:hypothetical protein